MNCKLVFTKHFLQQCDATLIKQIYKPYSQHLLWEREKGLLPQTQHLVDWEVQVEALKKRLRFGERVVFPKKPLVLLSSSGQIFPCPSTDCRGFVTGKRCAVCKHDVCVRCHEFDGAEHECNPATLESLAMLSKDSRPCPSCAALIFRSTGCNHMFCTNCRTHFDWESGHTLKTSSNGHYNTTEAFNKNVNMISKTTMPLGECMDPMSNAVPESVIPTAARERNLYRLLYKETATIRLIMDSMFHVEKLLRQHEEGMIQVRINFLRNKINEEGAKSKIYSLEQQYEKKLHTIDILTQLLGSLNEVQMGWRQGNFNEDEEQKLLPFVQRLLKACEEACVALHDEYGGATLKFNLEWQRNAAPLVSF